MLCSRAYWALLRRNAVYRKRGLIGSLLEMILPVGFICILLAIKIGVENDSSFKPQTQPPIFPGDNLTIIPLSFQDYVSSSQASRICQATTFVDNNARDIWDFEISDFGDNQNPFLKCDRRRCTTEGQDATDFCEHLILAVAPASSSSTIAVERTDKFAAYMETTYPGITTLASSSFVKVFESEQELEKYVTSENYGKSGFPKMGFGIIFSQGVNENDYAYTLRLNSTNFNQPEQEAQPASSTTPPTGREFSDFANLDNVCIPEQGGAPDQGPLQQSCTGQYLYNGAITMQRTVQDWILSESGTVDAGYRVAEHGVQFVSFPTNEFLISGFYSSIEAYAPLLIVLGLLYPAAAIIRAITVEKQLRQKELMKMMSVTESDIGWSWFTSFFLFHFVTAIFSAISSDALYVESAGVVLFIFWLLGFTAIITFAMFIATFFTKATTATLIGVLVFFIGYFLTLVSNYQDGSVGVISMVSLHPVSAIVYGILEIGRLEDLGVGATRASVTASDNPSGYNLSSCFSSLFFDCIVWGILTWYLNRVIRSQFGQPMPWYFPFTVSYWCSSSGRGGGTNNNNAEEEDGVGGGEEDNDGVPVEEVGDAMHASIKEGQGIAIKGLRKVFGEKIAVDGLNISMYPGQVTALLGHNGAGKTTTINMLTGMLAPTDGYAVLAGKDIRTDMGQIRQEIGICLQHDCLFPQLTVQEHISFFSRLKGLYSKYPKAEVEESIRKSIEDVALLEKRNTLSKNLSGGMKRKLSVAIAFCGESKTVLLDEPTSGMDPFSRRFTWDVIRQYRQDRCIILTTHFMDEADILGDRIAIMAEGQLRCAGSSLFLKKHYGVGYQLTIEKNAKAGTEDGTSSDNNDQKLENIVLESVSEASLLSNVGTEMSFQLPIGAASEFKAMFEQLDEEMDEGRIVTYGVSITTLDEVFLLVARGETGEKVTTLRSSKAAFDAETMAAEDEKSYRSRMDLDNDGLFTRHVQSLFRKRALNFKRDKKAWVCSTVLPSILVFMGFLLFKFVVPSRDLNALSLSSDSLNAGIKTEPRNPIPFNAPGNDFTCQPGTCMVGLNVFNESGRYSFCGLGFNGNIESSCSITESESIVGQLEGLGFDGVPQDNENVLQSSVSIDESRASFAASQFGAIQFTHDRFSQIDQNGTAANYSSAVVDTCSQVVAALQPTFVNESYCERYSGVGYVVNYNFTALHASLIYQAVADQALMREALPGVDATISATVHPLPLTANEESLGQAQDAFVAWFLVVLSFPFIAGTFATFVVSERSSKAKHLQTVAGVNANAYWLSSYLWDIMNYQLTCWITIILMFAFSVEALTTTERGVAGGSVVSLMLFGPAAAGFTYCVSFLFTSPSVCNLVVIITNFFVGLAGPLVVFILRIIGDPGQLDSPSLITAADAVQWVLRFVPSFNLGNALFKIINIQSIVTFSGKELTVWHADAILFETIFQAIWCIVYIALAIQIDKWSTNPRIVGIWQSVVRFLTCRCFCKKKEASGDYELAQAQDEDVIAENDRVAAGEANADLIVLDKLTKVYDNGKVAVNNMSLGIPPGQCFGLLGINGAGKTTTMGILTAEFPPSEGDATLASFSVSREPQKTRRRVGYCPQFDAHFANMTGREHVQLYAAIKGVPKEFVNDAVAHKLGEVGLSEFDSDRLSSGYSGGMKRKLSVACATIGQPQMVFLDEPSTGMDPVARRDLWAVISEMVTGGDIPDEERTSVILTTHSMEECEALCPRIGIMANGKLSCLGSAQHLKTRFGQGFQVEIKTKNVDRTDDDFIEVHSKIIESSGKVAAEAAETGEAGEILFTMAEALTALKALTDDDSLSSMVSLEHPTGRPIYKSLSSPQGCTSEEIASFAVSETRMANVEKFFGENFEAHVLRERQDNKARYEVSSQGTRISEIFTKIESNKEELVLSDYGVSQTSLEQVFNMHAAEAEKLKLGTNDS